jgi:mannose-1-phosphate guanylyltransferase / mannose-6-phosphate isomerase
MIHPIIMSGGAGERLWPISTPEHPKQLLPLVGGSSTFGRALELVSDRLVYAPPTVVTSGPALDQTLLLMRARSCEGLVMVETEAGGSACAVASGVSLMLAEEGDPVLLIMPADHVVGDSDVFAAAVLRAAGAAELGHIVCLGIEPTGPSTSYGYVRCVQLIAECDGVYTSGFREKPSEHEALVLLGRDYMWNAGYIVARASVLRQEMERWCPDVWAAASGADLTLASEDVVVVGEYGLPREARRSVDYALLEKTDRCAVTVLGCSWQDIGNWYSVWTASPRDERGCAVIGVAHLEDCDNVLVVSPEATVTVVGMRDCTVVISEGSTIVISHERAKSWRRSSHVRQQAE